MSKPALPKVELTQELLKQLVSYDENTGEFRWVKPESNRMKAGSIAGDSKGDGYWRLCVRGTRYGAHRLAWFYMTGVWPQGQIDHIDGDKGNNRFSNLRDVSKQENIQNVRNARRNNKSGLLGAHKNGSGYRTTICVDGKRVSFGPFATPDEAHSAYMEAKRIFHAGFVG